MKPIALWCGTISVLAVAIFAGCKPAPSSQPPLPVQEVPKVLTDAFKQAPPEASAVAQEIVTSVQAGDAIAFAQAQELAARGDLTDEQRKAANRAMAALHQKLLEEAAKGNEKAEEALKVYRATK